MSQPSNGANFLVRGGVSVVIGLLAGAATYIFWRDQRPGAFSDFAQLWHAARALLDGRNPYDAIGPGKAFPWDFPLLYPLPAVLVAVPFTALPLLYADAAFVAIGAGLLAWAVLKDDRPPFVFVSGAFLTVLVTSQWSTWLTAAAVTPSLGWLLACKPTVGAALWIAYPNRRALIGAAGLVGLSLIVQPFWWQHWLAGLPTAVHIQPPILRLGGSLVLLVLPWWRQADARLLLALACAPQTPVLYEALPLFLITRSIPEALILTLGTIGVIAGVQLSGPYTEYQEWMAWKGYWLVWLCYLPCVGIVLRRAYASRASTVDRSLVDSGRAS